MYRLFFFLLGFGLMVIGFTYIITYLNLLSMGYTFLDYLSFIIKRVECLFSVIGFIIISITIFTKGRDEFDLYIWYIA